MTSPEADRHIEFSARILRALESLDVWGNFSVVAEEPTGVWVIELRPRRPGLRPQPAWPATGDEEEWLATVESRLSESVGLRVKCQLAPVK